jgi:hypothetical protein
VFELLNKDLFQHIQDNNYEGFKVAINKIADLKGGEISE